MILSAALMVKNEEAHLDRCLQSVRKAFDEIVVLDTGSTDATIDIAKKYTTKVYHQTWQNNFALHRNKSFSYCKGDWILQIDADEELIFSEDVKPELLKYFIERIDAQGSINAVAFPLKDWRDSKNKFVAEFDVVRMFKRGHVKWQRRIHNEAMYDGQASYFNKAYLKHYGYDLTPEQAQAKAKRTIGLLEESIAENEKDYESLFYLAQAYASWGKDEDQALVYAERYVLHKDDLGKKFNPSIFHLIANLHMNVKNYDTAFQWIQTGLQFDPDDIDLCWDLMQIGLQTNDGKKVAIGAQRFVASYQNLPKTRLKHPGRFYFRTDIESYAIGLYHLFIAFIENTTIEYQKLQQILKKCVPSLKDEIENKTVAAMKAFGWETANDRKIITPADIGSNQIIQAPGSVIAQSGFASISNRS